jgi:hypothetical protein
VFGINVEERPAFLITIAVLPAGKACGALINAAIRVIAMRVVFLFMGNLVSGTLGKFCEQV